MALTIQPLFSKFPPALSNPSLTLLSYKHKTRISCNNGLSDAALSSELASKVAKMKTNLLQTEEAMKKSIALLFGEFCEYLDLKEDEMKHKWKRMDEEEKWVLVKGFVAEWGANFHPLSEKSAKEMVEEYLREERSSANSPPSRLFPGLGRMMGLSQYK
ncbi:hypothetical protein L6164_036433 [Bauhinia variegata]|uniref:Uncharacterized protein n=1 Tax=Bauhinia variegata TaxID=167791 RepID=A0ACB9KH24_BAUVA|nr:hypothetical protein L6164_036433 [Bauhinia variegata]